MMGSGLGSEFIKYSAKRKGNSCSARVIWKEGVSGNFSVKEAYRVLQEVSLSLPY